MTTLDPRLTADMTEWRRHLHRFPECGFDVDQTADFIADKLTSWGIDVVRGIGQSGLVGTLTRGSGSAAIGLRADMDALYINELNTFEHRSCHAGQMHACGHDGHSTMLLGAARHLAEHGDFDGTVHFIFQPDEEHGQGAQAMIDDGLFERFSMDAVFGLHNLPGLAEGHFVVRPGSLMASESSFKIVIEGTGGHAAQPHKGTDAMVVGAQVILALQTIVSRTLSPIDDPAVVSVTEFTTNGTVNVIPSQVTIQGDCRCFSDEALNHIRSTMERQVAGLCQAAGAQYRFDFVNTFYPTINQADATAQAVRAAEQVLGPERVTSDGQPLTLSEDFASMLRVKPGCYALLGNGVDSEGGCALHNPHYDFNDRILEHGAAYWVALVENHLTRSD